MSSDKSDSSKENPDFVPDLVSDPFADRRENSPHLDSIPGLDFDTPSLSPSEPLPEPLLEAPHEAGTGGFEPASFPEGYGDPSPLDAAPAEPYDPILADTGAIDPAAALGNMGLPETGATVPELLSADAPEEPLQPPEPAPAETIPAETPDALNPVRQFAESAGLAQSAQTFVTAAFPFSLLIEGPLTDYDKAKLLDVLSREQVGVREVDLEPQLQGDRVLIPRISEYAGVLIVQALRGTRARLRLGPADQIFSTEDTREGTGADSEGKAQTPPAAITATTTQEGDHPAEKLPMTQGESLPGIGELQVLDTLLASATLKSELLEVENSLEYQRLLEALKRELKYKAFHKGAIGIIRFQSQLTPLSLSATRYHLLLSGTAVTLGTPAE